ncbi:MAG: hypothetical protein CMM01_01545 [Rhodopirellula sp.]|nr:hypothetical protein [Rhodopirellula sp.]
MLTTGNAFLHCLHPALLTQFIPVASTISNRVHYAAEERPMHHLIFQFLSVLNLLVTISDINTPL